MKNSRYRDEQIVRILREADRAPITEVAKRHGVSEASIYAWRNPLQLFSLISERCAHRGSLPGPYCRLIVDSSLPWAGAPIDARRSWMYLTQPALLWRMADCLVLTGD